MGRGSVVVLLICLAFTITVGISLSSFSCFVAVCPCCICTGIPSVFIYASFSAIRRAIMTYFTDNTIARLIATLCLRIDTCYNIWYLSTNYLHILCILICIHHIYEKSFPPIHTQKELLKIPHVGLILQSTALTHPYNMMGRKIWLMIKVLWKSQQCLQLI